MNDTALNEILSFDPLGNAETLTGKSYKNDESTMALGLVSHLAHTANKRKLLQSLDDTTFSNTLERYTRIITEEGFVCVLSLPFAAEDGTPESFQVWFHPDGLLLRFDTYRTKNVNSATFYFMVQLNDHESRRGLRCSNSYVDYDAKILQGDFDAREAVRFSLRTIRAVGTLLNPWPQQQFIWLLHYMDTKKKDYNYEAITAERIAMLPEHVRKAITPETEL